MIAEIEQHLEAGRLDQASRLLSDALSKNPNDVDALVAQARLKGASGDAAEAVRMLDRAIALEPSHPKARGYHGVMLVQSGRADEARPHLKAAIGAGITDGSVHYGYAICMASKGGMEQAVASMDKAVADQPKNWHFLFVRARMHSELGHPEKSLVDLRAAVQADPKQEEPWLVLCTILLNLGETRDAISNLQKAQRFVADGARLQELLAQAALADGNPELAAVTLETLSKAHPNDTTTMGNLALAYVATGRIKMAESVYRRAIGMAPGDAVLHYQLGSLLESQPGEASLDEAVACYQKAIELDATLWEPLNDLGRLHITQERMNDVDRAFEYFAKAKAIAGDQPELLFNQALAHAHRGEIAECVRLCKGIQASKSAPPALVDQAHALAKHVSA